MISLTAGLGWFFISEAPLREIVSVTADTEFTAFKALLDLKEAGKHYDLEAISYK